ncbi:MAG TPA: hypothetical protein VFP84_19625 [Kofleriaceae bacterium]|nr:hypothetical protein [Kofleriaceae bacterium]
MKPALTPGQLKKTHAWEYLVRFAFGGAISTLTGLIGHAWGPWIAGLFLAFPAILPASLTLVKQHDGRSQAIEDARGARLATLGLWGFAGVVIVLAGEAAPPIVLVAATLAWLAIALGLWLVRYGRAASGS